MIEIYKYTNTQSGDVEYSADDEKYDETDRYMSKKCITLQDEECLQPIREKQTVAWVFIDASCPSRRFLEWEENPSGYFGEYLKYPLVLG